MHKLIQSKIEQTLKFKGFLMICVMPSKNNKNILPGRKWVSINNHHFEDQYFVF